MTDKMKTISLWISMAAVGLTLFGLILSVGAYARDRDKDLAVVETEQKATKERQDRFETRYSNDIKELKTKIDKMYDIMIKQAQYNKGNKRME